MVKVLVGVWFWILPVNPKFLPRTEDEKEMVSRTVYCTNIDKNVGEDAIKNFFEGMCGEVARLRLLGDYVHSTCIAFVEVFQLHGVDDYIGKSKKILVAMSKRMDRNKRIVGGIIATLVLAILFILYFKLASPEILQMHLDNWCTKHSLRELLGTVICIMSYA